MTLKIINLYIINITQKSTRNHPDQDSINLSADNIEITVLVDTIKTVISRLRRLGRVFPGETSKVPTNRVYF